jgi:predicted adenine nucleotide alpha hydrolase (AANH) superfamily ATPase
VKELGTEKDLLLHICCAPCLTYTHEELDRLGIEFSGFWYNPNIHPYTEYKKRLEALRTYMTTRPMAFMEKDEYDIKRFCANALQHENNGKLRCEYCYRSRLEVTAKQAKEEGFKRFSTTLLFSRYQKHDLLKQVGEEVAREQGIEFFYHDFRPGWNRSIEICKELDIYRQKYCGCIFSEEERFLGTSLPAND